MLDLQLVTHSANVAAVFFWQSLPGSLTFTAQQGFHFAGKAWAIWAIWWLAMAFFSKSTKRRETGAQRIEHVVPAVLGFLLIFQSGFGGLVLSRRVFLDNPVLVLICAIATIFGLLFAVWARLALGRNWSGSVTIKNDHQLIRRGPYRWIRHPIYTGMLAALLATVVIQGMISGLLGFALIWIALYRKAKREESFLSQEFGEAFAEHRQHTGMFLPHFS